MANLSRRGEQNQTNGSLEIVESFLPIPNWISQKEYENSTPGASFQNPNYHISAEPADHYFLFIRGAGIYVNGL